ncbi:uncharacterized protein [Antedon mediterranea]|uniref:uncharacterized protein n=1 Tax=Antedon mediterranea TaxID=105859 RepID=UPI003AF4FD91
MQGFYDEPPLLIVTGGCISNFSQYISSDVIHISSQKFDDVSTNENTFSVALWLGSGSPGLSEYLASHQISLVDVVHEDGAYYEQVMFSVVEHLKYYNIQTSSLLLSGHVTNDVFRIETNFIRHMILIASDATLNIILCELYQRPTLPHAIYIFTTQSTCNIIPHLNCIGVTDWSIQDVTCLGVSTYINVSFYCFRHHKRYKR